MSARSHQGSEYHIIAILLHAQTRYMVSRGLNSRIQPADGSIRRRQRSHQLLLGDRFPRGY